MTEIRLYNTATREKAVFEPLNPDDVRMYVCGPTVYDRAHIGNARPVVVFDVLYRLLRHVYGSEHVTYVRNFTDIDDKINKRAAETRKDGESTIEAIRRITDETIGWYHEDTDALGAMRPDAEPRATDHVDGMIGMIEALIEKGHAYEAEGHVLFHVPSYDGYGSLSRRPLDEMEAGARVDVAPYKKSPMDFVLWKPSDDSLPGWESPWGRGRPGWHIECSVMAKALLGERFDIHGGGIDLQFPHHENELAQSCCASGLDKMATVWMHNGFLQVEGEKMSKSLGNFFTVADLRGRLPGSVIRYVLMNTHYRSPLDWTEDRVEQARTVLNRWLRLHERFRRSGLSDDAGPDGAVIAALADDLNTAGALQRVHDLAKGPEAETDESALKTVIATIRFLGFDLKSGADRDAAFDTAEAIRALCSELDEARAAKDYGKADAIRDRMQEAGLAVRTTKDGTEAEPTVDFDPAKLEAVG